MRGDSARRDTDSVRAGAVSRRALSRLLAVLVLCVGIGLGVVSPSSADATGVGGSVMLASDPGRPALAATWTVVDNSTTTDWSFRVTVTVAVETGDMGYFQPVMHCAAGERAGQWMYGTQGSVFRPSIPQGANVGWGKDGCADVDQIGVATPGQAYGWSGTAPTGSVASTTPGPPDVSAGSCIGRDWQLAALLRSVGWIDDAEGRTALAVLLAESSGRVNAVNENTDGSYDLGLFQINTTAHPELDAQRLGVDPLYNALKAHELRQGAGGWDQWVAYSSGRYRPYLERAASAWADPAAGDALAATSCAELTGQEPATGGDPLDPNDPATSGGECSGWNPLTYIKCALVWAFVPGDAAMSGWSSRVGTWSDRFPVNVMVSGTEAVGAFTEAVRCSDQSCSLPDRDPRAVAFDGLPGGASVDVLGGMSDEAVSPTLNRVRDFTGWLIWIGGSVYIWRRVSASFGGKDAA